MPGLGPAAIRPSDVPTQLPVRQSVGPLPSRHFRKRRAISKLLDSPRFGLCYSRQHLQQPSGCQLLQEVPNLRLPSGKLIEQSDPVAPPEVPRSRLPRYRRLLFRHEPQLCLPEPSWVRSILRHARGCSLRGHRKALHCLAQAHLAHQAREDAGHRGDLDGGASVNVVVLT